MLLSRRAPDQIRGGRVASTVVRQAKQQVARASAQVATAVLERRQDAIFWATSRRIPALILRCFWGIVRLRFHSGGKFPTKQGLTVNDAAVQPKSSVAVMNFYGAARLQLGICHDARTSRAYVFRDSPFRQTCPVGPIARYFHGFSDSFLTSPGRDLHSEYSAFLGGGVLIAGLDDQRAIRLWANDAKQVHSESVVNALYSCSWSPFRRNCILRRGQRLSGVHPHRG